MAKSKTVIRGGRKVRLRGKALALFEKRSAAARKGWEARRARAREALITRAAEERAKGPKFTLYSRSLLNRAIGEAEDETGQDFFFGTVLPELYHGPLATRAEKLLAPYYGKRIRVDVIGEVLYTRTQTRYALNVGREIEELETYRDVVDAVRDLVKEQSREYSQSELNKLADSPFAYLVSLVAFVPLAGSGQR